jgi:hypothetical protein
LPIWTPQNGKPKLAFSFTIICCCARKPLQYRNHRSRPVPRDFSKNPVT